MSAWRIAGFMTVLASLSIGAALAQTPDLEPGVQTSAPAPAPAPAPAAVVPPAPAPASAPASKTSKAGVAAPAAPQPGAATSKSSDRIQLDTTQIIAGTPDQVIPKLRHLMEETRPGIMAFWANDGSVSPEDTRTCIRLLGQEVMPAVREIGKSLGLNGPFDVDAPVSLAYSKDLRQPAAAAQ